MNVLLAFRARILVMFFVDIGNLYAFSVQGTFAMCFAKSTNNQFIIFIMREMQNDFIVLLGPYVLSICVSLMPQKWLLGIKRGNAKAITGNTFSP